MMNRYILPGGRCFGRIQKKHVSVRTNLSFKASIVRAMVWLTRRMHDYAVTIDQSTFETYLRRAAQLCVKLECGACATRNESRTVC